MFRVRAVTSGLIAALAAACIGMSAAVGDEPGRKPAAPADQLRITGSSTMAPMIADVAKRFQAQHPGVLIHVQSGGSGRGIGDVRENRAHIGMASRALSDKESGLYSFAMARDGIALIVHKDNQIRSLSPRQVIDIFTGKITNWRAVGGRDAAIIVMAPEEGYSSTELFTDYLNIEYREIKSQVVLGDNAGRIQAIVERPDGITYASVGLTEHRANAGTPVKLLPTDGVAATSKTIRSGDYPLSRPLLLLTREPPAGLAKAFIDFSLSSQVTELVEQHEFVPYLD